MSGRLAQLLDRGGVALFARLNGLLDKQVNTPEGARQMARDLEEAIRDLADATAQSAGTVTGLQRTITEKTSNKSELEDGALLLLGDDDPSNDNSAYDLQAQATDLEGELTELNSQLAAAQATNEALNTTMQKLRDKHAEMMRKIREITVAAAGAKAKENAVAALEMAQGALGGVNTDSVDSVVGAIHQRADAADARLGTLLTESAGGSAQEDLRRAKAKAALQAKLAQVRAAAVQAAQPGDDVPAGATAS